MTAGVRLSMLVGLATALMLAACTSDKPTPGATAGVNPSLQAPSVSASADGRTEVQKAFAAYTNLLNAFTAASNSGTDDTTELAKYATGSALQLLAKGLADNKAKGLHSQGAPVIDPPKVTEFSPPEDPTRIGVSGCVDSTNWLLYKSNGQPADTTPGGRRRTAAQVEKGSDGVWRVTSLAIQGTNTC